MRARAHARARREKRSSESALAANRHAAHVSSVKTTTATPLIQGVAWSGSDLIAVDPDVVDSRIRRKALSASTSKAMKSCLARFVGEKLLPREDDPFSDSELGTSTHAVGEDLYNLPAAERTLLTFDRLRAEHAEKKWSAEEFAKSGIDDATAWDQRKERWLNEINRLGRGIFDIENPADQVVHETEMSFDGVLIAGVPAMGFIDRVDVVKVRNRDRFKAIDLKTGKMKSPFDLRRYGDDHGDQIRLYSDAIREVTGESAAIGEIHYTQFGTAREISLSEMNMEKTRKDFRTAWDVHNRSVEAGVFPTKAGPLCSWCPLVNACPAAAAAGKTVSDRVKVEPASAVALGIPTVRPDAAKPLGTKVAVIEPVGVASTKPAPAAPSAPAPRNDVPPVDPYETVVDVSSLGQSRLVLDAANAASAAHVPSDKAASTGTGTPAMNTLFSEGKPWEPVINGKLNAASYAAMAVTSLPQIAGELLVEAGRPLNGSTIDRLTDLLAEIIVTVQKDVRGGEFSWDDGINTRIRGALRTTISTLPLPWDATTDAEWEAWQVQATKRTAVFIRKAVRLFELGDTIGHTSFAALLPNAVADIKPKPGVRQVA